MSGKAKKLLSESMTIAKLLLREMNWVGSECEAVMGYFEVGEGSRHFPSGSATLFAGSNSGAGNLRILVPSEKNGKPAS